MTLYEMEFVRKCLISLLLAVGWLVCLSQAQQVSVIPSKHILTAEDQNVILHCASYGLQANPYNVVVFTVMDKVVYNSSNTSGVEVINSTAIAYSNIGNGVIDVACKINNTMSLIPTTITYVAPVSFTHSPSGFSPNNSYTATCVYSITPNVSNIVVNFNLNQTTFAHYLNLPFQAPQFGSPNKIPGLNVVQGNETSSIFIQPTNSSAEGNYQCSVTVSLSSGSVTVNSDVWNTNSSITLMPSILLLALSIVFVFCFSSK